MGTETTAISARFLLAIINPVYGHHFTRCCGYSMPLKFQIQAGQSVKLNIVEDQPQELRTFPEPAELNEAQVEHIAEDAA